MPPTVPAPLQPRSVNKTPRIQDPAVKEARKLKSIQEDNAVQALTELVNSEIKRISEELGQSESHIRGQLFIEAKASNSHRKTNPFNAVVHAVAEQENRNLPVGAKLSLAEITQKVHDEKIYDTMPDEELNALVKRLEAQRSSKEAGRRVTPQQKVSDASHTLTRIQQQLVSLYQRVGIRSILFSVRSDASFKFDPFIWLTDDVCGTFMERTFKMEPLQIGTYMEAWSLVGGKDNPSDQNYKKRCHKHKHNIRQLINKGLADITKDKVAMSYTDQYDDCIIMKYGVWLVGWPLDIFRNPSNITNISDLQKLENALTSGACHWVRLTDEEFEKYKEDLERQVAAGLRKPLVNVSESVGSSSGAAGMKRKAGGGRSAPPKRARMINGGAGNSAGNLHETIMQF